MTRWPNAGKNQELLAELQAHLLAQKGHNGTLQDVLGIAGQQRPACACPGQARDSYCAPRCTCFAASQSSASESQEEQLELHRKLDRELQRASHSISHGMLCILRHFFVRIMRCFSAPLHFIPFGHAPWSFQDRGEAESWKFLAEEAGLLDVQDERELIRRQLRTAAALRWCGTCSAPGCLELLREPMTLLWSFRTRRRLERRLEEALEGACRECTRWGHESEGDMSRNMASKVRSQEAWLYLHDDRFSESLHIAEKAEHMHTHTYTSRPIRACLKKVR